MFCPLSFNFDNAPENITMTLNPNSWTTMANVIFVDMRAGAGFSYATTKEASISSDSSVVKQANDFLRKFLIDHPKFLKNPLYISGISYMGIVTPILTSVGYILCSPLTNKYMDFNSRVEYAHRMALISDDIYKSQGSENGVKPIYRFDQEGVTRRYLQRETPQRRFPWNSKKKSLSPGCKEMLLKRIKEVQAFNASKESAKAREHGEGSGSTQKEKRARCYICRIRGHVFWKCPNKNKKAIFKKQKGIVKPTFKKVAEKVKYPEKVHVITDYMIEGTDDANWNETWYVSSAYKQHMCPSRSLFKKLKYKFEMIEKEEIEKKFIFSYGVGDVTMETKEGNFVIPNVHYTPEVTLNVLSFDLLEEQGYVVKISNNKCNIHYMFGGARTGKAQEENLTEDEGLKDVVIEHNKFLDKYFESIEPKNEESLVRGLEELKWDRDDDHDYVDEEYISWNGSLYAIKVNSLSRFLSFMDLMKKDSMVYKHWDIFSKKYVEMLKWFYLVYLNYDRLDEIPPVVGVMEINLLSLHKIVDSLGGYLCVTLGDKWKTVASLQGLTEDDEEAIKGCYKRFIDMVQVYYETAKKPWYEKKPKKDVVESSSGNARVKDPQGKEKGDAGREDALEEDMNKETKFEVRSESNLEKEAEEGSITDSNDFEVIEYYYDFAANWANDEAVQQALDIRKGTIGTWQFFNTTMHYVEGKNDTFCYSYDIYSSYSFHKKLVSKNCRALIFSGGHDMTFPYVGIEEWIGSLNLAPASPWKPFYVDNQVGGYKMTYAQDDFSLTFATVKGAGHSVAQYKPKEAMLLTEKWLATKIYASSM
ncbi:ARID DNA-binding domain-containing protein [Tanacetum coccineum]